MVDWNSRVADQKRLGQTPNAKSLKKSPDRVCFSTVNLHQSLRNRCMSTTDLSGQAFNLQKHAVGKRGTKLGNGTEEGGAPCSRICTDWGCNNTRSSYDRKNNTWSSWRWDDNYSVTKKIETTNASHVLSRANITVKIGRIVCSTKSLVGMSEQPTYPLHRWFKKKENNRIPSL